MAVHHVIMQCQPHTFSTIDELNLHQMMWYTYTNHILTRLLKSSAFLDAITVVQCYTYKTLTVELENWESQLNNNHLLAPPLSASTQWNIHGTVEQLISVAELIYLMTIRNRRTNKKMISTKFMVKSHFHFSNAFWQEKMFLRQLQKSSTK